MDVGGLTFFAPSEERLESGLYSRTYLENQVRPSSALSDPVMRLITLNSKGFVARVELEVRPAIEDQVRPSSALSGSEGSTRIRQGAD